MSTTRNPLACALVCSVGAPCLPEGVLLPSRLGDQVLPDCQARFRHEVADSRIGLEELRTCHWELPKSGIRTRACVTFAEAMI